MANKVVHLPVLNGLGQTLRKDNWWAGPLVTFIVLASFVVYATFRAFEGRFYAVGPYLSPLASPYFETKDLGIPFVTPAILILPFPGLFRFTCYYYRKAYYRSFAMTPPACAVGAARPGAYNGERKLLIFQNLHRFAMYFALLFLVFLWHDFIKSLSFEGHAHFGLGCLVIFANCTFLVALHDELPLVPPPHRRQREQLLGGAVRHAPPQALEPRVQAEHRPHVVRVGQPLRRRALRFLHPVRCLRRDHRHQILLIPKAS